MTSERDAESLHAFERLVEQRRAAAPLLPRQEVQEWMNSDLDLHSMKTLGQSAPRENRTRFGQFLDQAEEPNEITAHEHAAGLEPQ